MDTTNQLTRSNLIYTLICLSYVEGAKLGSKSSLSIDHALFVVKPVRTRTDLASSEEEIPAENMEDAEAETKRQAAMEAAAKKLESPTD